MSATKVIVVCTIAALAGWACCGDAAARGRGAQLWSALGSQMGASDAYVRTSAVSKLWSMGAKAVPFLIRALKDKRPRVRKTAAWALGVLGPKARAAIPALARILKGREHSLSRLAADALGKIGGRSLPALSRAIAHSDPWVRLSALRGLSRIGPKAAAAIPSLRKRLMAMVTDPSDCNLKSCSCGACVGKVGASFSISRMFRRKGPRRHEFVAIVHLLRQFPRKSGVELRKVVKPLASKLYYRGKMRYALQYFGRYFSSSVPYLRRVATGKPFPMNYMACELLGMIGAPALPTLRKLLRHRNPKLRVYAFEALVFMGPKALPAFDAMMKALQRIKLSRLPGADTEEDSIADEGFYRMGKRAFRPLVRYLAHKRPKLRLIAAKNLRRYGRRSILKKMSKHKDREIRALAQEALGEYKRRQQERREDARYRASQRKRKVKVASIKAMPQWIRSLVTKRGWYFWKKPVGALAAHGSRARVALPALILALDAHDLPKAARAAILRAIVKIGHRRQWRPVLRYARRDAPKKPRRWSNRLSR